MTIPFAPDPLTRRGFLLASAAVSLAGVTGCAYKGSKAPQADATPVTPEIDGDLVAADATACSGRKGGNA